MKIFAPLKNHCPLPPAPLYDSPCPLPLCPIRDWKLFSVVYSQVRRKSNVTLLHSNPTAKNIPLMKLPTIHSILRALTLVPFCALATPCLGQEPAKAPMELERLREWKEKAIASATDPINQKYVEYLSALRKQFTQLGKLQEALAVDAELKNSQSPKGSPVNPPGQAPDVTFKEYEGIWTVTYKSGFTHKYSIAADGKVTIIAGGNGERQLYKKKGDTLLDFADNKLERFQMKSGRLFVEHWSPVGSYAARKPPGDTGTSSEKK